MDTMEKAVDAGPTTAPAVGLVLVTHNRPVLMRKALESALDQDYAGMVDVVVVYDRSDPDLTLERDEPHRRVRVVSNARTPGLAGARNTGLLLLDTPLAAFCDDDDEWLPGKLRAQVDVFVEHPEVAFCSTGMRVLWKGTPTDRLAGTDRIVVQHLTRSRMAMLHSSSFVFRRQTLIEEIGLVDETLPNSMAEDWDLLIRAARIAPIAHLDTPMVSILWGATSYFNDAWHDKNLAHEWLFAQHPEFARDPRSSALLTSKLAFGHAALGHRRQALSLAARALRTRWKEPRTAFALLVVAGVPAKWITVGLNRRGHGI